MGSPRILTCVLLAGMILGTYRGQLALWTEGATEPLTVYPCHISMLPETDQHRLLVGIPIENQRRLHSLLEDYLS